MQRRKIRQHHAQHGKAVQLAAANGDFSGQFSGMLAKIALRLVRQLYNLLRAAAKPQAVLGQRDVMIAADEQLYAQLVLQLCQLTRNGGLRNMQKLRGAGDVFLAGNGQKIAQNAQFHGFHPPSSSF